MNCVVITGVSTGIGFNAADILCDAGYRVYGSVRKIEDAKKLSEKHGPLFKPLIFDVRDEDAINKSARYVSEDLKKDDKQF